MDDNDVKVLSETFVTLAEAEAHPTVEKNLKEKHRKSLRPEFLDPIDAELRLYEPLLEDKEKETYDKLDTTYKKQKFMNKYLSERSKGSSSDAETFKKELGKIQEQIKNGDYIPKADYEKVSGKVSAAQEGKTFARLFAMSVPKMSKDKLKDGEVQDDYNSRINKMLKKKGWVIDHETDEIRKASAPEEAVLVKGSMDTMTIEHIPGVFYEEYEDWAQKSDGKTEEEVEIDRTRGGGSNKDSVAERNRQRAQGA